MLRPARPDEVDDLSALCLRAKAHWGYDQAFLAQCRDALTVDPTAIRGGDVFVAADGADRPVGLHQIGGIRGTVIELVLLYVEPTHHRRGIGRTLLAHAAALAHERRAATLSIVADPHAADFYRAQGAVPAGEASSNAIPGRMLPVFHLALT
jgi:GNAT superfamily N-acetyltransferase